MITFWEGLSLPWFPMFAPVFIILGLLMIGGMIAMVTIRQRRTAIEILHARFASGNIDRAEYDHRRHLADEFERIRRWAVLARTRKVR
jgi:uncharacterized membrane protein